MRTSFVQERVSGLEGGRRVRLKESEKKESEVRELGERKRAGERPGER